MINYIKKISSYEIEVSKEGHVERLSMPLRQWLVHEAQRSFRTIDSVSSRAKSLFPQQRKLPLWINHDLLLMVIHSLDAPDALCINYFAVLSRKQTMTSTVTVLFQDGTLLYGISKAIWQRQWQVASALLKYVQNLL